MQTIVNMIFAASFIAALSFLVYAYKHSQNTKRLITRIEESDGLFFVDLSYDGKRWINIGNRTTRHEAEKLELTLSQDNLC